MIFHFLFQSILKKQANIVLGSFEKNSTNKKILRLTINKTTWKLYSRGKKVNIPY